MFQNLDIFRTAMALARHSGTQQALSAQNIANADTPGYRAREMPKFQDTLRGSLIGQRATREAHLNGQVDRSADSIVRDTHWIQTETLSLSKKKWSRPVRQKATMTGRSRFIAAICLCCAPALAVVK